MPASRRTYARLPQPAAKSTTLPQRTSIGAATGCRHRRGIFIGPKPSWLCHRTPIVERLPRCAIRGLAIAWRYCAERRVMPSTGGVDTNKRVRRIYPCRNFNRSNSACVTFGSIRRRNRLSDAPVRPADCVLTRRTRPSACAAAYAKDDDVHARHASATILSCSCRAQAVRSLSKACAAANDDKAQIADSRTIGE